MQLTTLNGKGICPLVVEAVSAASPVSASNDCGCSVFGECNSEGDCDCQNGHSGFACSYSDSDYLSLCSRITEEVDHLASSVGGLSHREILYDLGQLTKTPEVVTLPSANSALTILQTAIDSNSSSQLKQNAL